MTKRARTLVSLLLATLIVSCAPNTPEPSPSPAPTAVPQASATATATSTPMALGLYRAPEVPDALVAESDRWGIPLVANPSQASLHLELVSAGDEATIASRSTWIYALVAPFPTVTDGVTLDELKAAWNGSPPGHVQCAQCEALAGSPLWMTESTLAAFTALWGASASEAVQTAPADELVAALWDNRPSWGILPFEELEPKLKVLSVDGQSPIHKDFDIVAYPLKAEFALRALDREPAMLNLAIPNTNRVPTRMTTVILTGVTALVRATAYTMETKGVTYPARDIRDFMRAADITHISNEIPFYTGCDFPNPSRSKLVFCSDPKYIELLEDVGADVVELTGNHFADYGPGAMLETLDIYNRNNIAYYGGGADLEDARKPLTLENHSNKIAFIGCNPVDLGKPPVATETKPGAAPCSHKYLVDTIQDLKAQGYFVISTFQHQEYYSPEARPDQLEDFHRVADAGASIVSGSQAHFAQMMEFYNDSFIHYGLGNLFFDQMGDIPYYLGIRREFIDRYVIYNGKLLSVELLTTMLVDYSRPRLMTPEERASFLNEYFYHSGWGDLIPTPTLQPTVTLTPMTLPQPFTTITPAP
ncbi:MAG: CapA family protein [Anaerolineales bacterium]|nr:CapA family protein [Anaerolineales bacterium]